MVEQKSPVVAWIRRMVRRGPEPRYEREDSHDGDEYKAYYEEVAAEAAVPPTKTSEAASPATGALPRSQSRGRIDPGRGAGETHGLAHPGLRVGRNPTDNASVMTIASSSKRRRKSLDTNASTRALAAESICSAPDSEAASLRSPDIG